VVSARPLAGTTVVDFTRFVSGAWSTMVLASLGADVVKVEGLPDGDPYRVQGTSFVDGRSTLFLGLNAGKRSVAVDLRVPEGRAVVERLLETADVFVENGRPGSLARLGLDFEAVHQRHPQVVYASVSAYGQVGPQASTGGFDLIVQAESGVMSVTGTEESGPVKVGAPFLDVGAGISCVGAVLAGLLQRQQTGAGLHVSSSLLEFAVSGFVGSAASFFEDGREPGLLGSHSPTFAPYGAFRCRDDHLVIAGAGSERLWEALCVVLGAPQLVGDERFRTNADRVRNRDELTAVLESLLAQRDAVEWQQLLQEAGVPVAQVRTLGQVLRSPQVDALGLVRELQSGPVGYRTVGPPFTVDGVLDYPCGTPELGEHTRQVMVGLGWSDADVDRLAADGAVMAP
jgi:crotonobetainyl-CoA:carnitine CoA-transferase CaiB-like acyl-CoA transferase